MIALNRKTQPGFRQVEKIEMIKAEKLRLANGLPLYVINAGTQDVLKIDFIFNAGSWEQDKPLTAFLTNLMLNEGTKNFTGCRIAEKFDYYGAHFTVNADKQYATLTLITLSKYLKETLEIVEDILKRSVFPQKEYESVLQREKQQFIVENTKVNILARNKFSQVLYGSSHPYGKVAILDDYDNLPVEQLRDFYLRLYSGNNCNIIIAGKIGNDTLKTLDRFLGGKDWIKKCQLNLTSYKAKGDKEKFYLLKKEDAVQSALRVGKVLFNKLHPDFLGMQVLNTILGGYFGSRLMANIREDKGYTYGIGSIFVSMKNSGFFVIVSEVGADVSHKTIKEIELELKKLRNELVPEDELKLVRNYMLGEMLNAFDGPFALAEAFRGLLDYDLDYDFYDKAVHTIKTITAKELNTLANKYLHEGTMYKVVAGK
ncbi:MAG: insulinase family protein [Bacteroidia bacterium]|nr:insulinase family protein [Bacteroidia bacterium]